MQLANFIFYSHFAGMRVLISSPEMVSLHALHRLTKADTFSTCMNSLPYDKILDWSILKGFADDKININ